MTESLKTTSMHVTRDVIRAYAEVSGDFNPIHIDPEFAATTPMKGIIAHGLLSLNLIWQSLRQTLGDDAIGQLALDVRFLKPVRENDVVTAGGARGEDGAWQVWVRNQRGEPVIAGKACCAIEPPL